MKKLLTLLLFPILISLPAKATNYYLAAAGNDANNGTSASTPWKTLTKLNSFFSSLKPGDNVYLNKGDVFYGTITINAGGSSGAPITIGSFGTGANPVVTGFSTVNTWTSVGSNIWESTSAISSLSSCNMVTVHGTQQAMGRYPNSGYLTYQTFSGSTSITSSSLGATNWTGAEAVIKKNDYVLDRCTVTNLSGTMLSYSDPYSTYTPTDGYGFFIQNDVRTLDSLNEWYFNPTTKKIRVYNTTTPAGVQVATLSNLVANNGFNYITLENIAFTGSSSDAIYYYGVSTDYCSILNCSVSFGGQNGIYIVNGINGTISNDTLNYCNRAGIQSDAGSGFTISNNTVTNIGMVVGQAYAGQYTNGIYVSSLNPTIKYNAIKDVSYNGIFLSNSCGSGLVQYNFVDSNNVKLDDGGGVYTMSTATGVRTIDHNVILNTIGNRDGTTVNRPLSAGIYLDNGATNVVVTNNSVANSGNAGYKFHRTNNIIVNNNTGYNNGYWQVFYQNDVSVPTIYSNIMKNNIFVASSYTSSNKHEWVVGYNTGANDIASFGTADSNYYARPLLDSVTFDTYQSNTGSVSRTLAGWQSFSGLDAHSKKSPVDITSLTNLIFEYNANATSQTISLGAAYVDMKNKSYNGSITLAPYASAVLIKTGAATMKPPVANAGADQTITLPTSSVTLTGNATDSTGTITAYAWTKVSGPSPDTIKTPATATTPVTGLTQGVYQFQLKVTDNNNLSAVDTVQVTVNAAGNLLAASSLSNPVNGVNYQYYELTGLTALPVFSSFKPTSIGTTTNINISVATIADNFALDFTGYIYIPANGQYTFYTNSDDGSNLLIDNVPVVNNDGVHSATTHSGTIGLMAGYHAITVGYFQQLGGSSLSVSYSGPGIAETAIPASALYTSAVSNLLPASTPSGSVNGLNYSYYQGSSFTALPAFSSLTATSTGTTTNFDISVATRTYNFAINFTGYVSIPADGQYTFYTNSDDGSKLYIDNVLVVSNDGVHPATTQSGTIGLQAGLHAIGVGYFQNFGGSTLTVSYAGPGISQEAIPAASLFSVPASGSNIVGLDNGADQAISAASPFGLNVFPNPFLNTVNVNIDGAAGAYKLVLVDISGHILWTMQGVKSAGRYEQSINTSTMQRGMYFLRVLQDTKSAVVKVEKQ